MERGIYWVAENTPDFELNMYGKILERNNIVWNSTSMRIADVSELDAWCVMALLVAVIRAERFRDGGVLLPFLREGIIQRWLI